MKKCSKCELEKSLSEFYKAKTNTDGHMKWCKECEKLRKTSYYNSNSENQKAVAKAYREKNKGLIKTKKAEYYKSKKDYFNKKNKERYSKHKEDFFNYVRERRARKRSSSDKTVTKEFLETLMKVQKSKCFYCSCNLKSLKSSDVHLDHYIPLSKGGVHSAGNVVWSCSKCNNTKHNTVPVTPLIFNIKDTLSKT